jgi:hypothetical protein
VSDVAWEASPELESIFESIPRGCFKIAGIPDAVELFGMPWF